MMDGLWMKDGRIMDGLWMNGKLMIDGCWVDEAKRRMNDGWIVDEW
jgi:hypothetical protein